MGENAKREMMQKPGIFSKWDSIALAICILTFSLWAFIVAFKYYHFQYHDWDLAFFAQALWNLGRGNLHVSLLNTNFFANHLNLIAVFILPLFKIFPHPLTLVLLKVLSYTAGAFVLYILAKAKLPLREAVLLMVLYLCYLPNIHGILYEFHFESLSPAFFLLLFYFYEKKRIIAFAITVLLTMLIKENMPLVIAGFGIYALWGKKRNKWLWGVAPFVLGVMTFYLMTDMLIPRIHGGGAHPYFQHYQHLGFQSTAEIVSGIVSNPRIIISELLGKNKITYLSELFAPLLFLPVYSPHSLIPILPILMQYMLSSQVQEQTISFHYVLTIAPFLFVATLNALAMLQNKTRKKFIKHIWICLILINAIYLIRERDNVILSIHHDRIEKNMTRAKWQLIKQIPSDEPVIATFGFLPELSRREKLYAFHKIYHPKHQGFLLPADVSYGMIDFGDLWLRYFLDRSEKDACEVSERIRRRFPADQWRIKDMSENVVLFARGLSKGEKLVEINGNAGEIEEKTAVVSLEDGILLDSVQSSPHLAAEKQYISFVFNWRCLVPVEENYIMVLFIKKDEGYLAYRMRMIGYAFYPTAVWKKGDHIKERYRLSLPDLQSGEYSVEMILINPVKLHFKYVDRRIVEKMSYDMIELTKFEIE